MQDSNNLHIDAAELTTGGNFMPLTGPKTGQAVNRKPFIVFANVPLCHAIGKLI
jgi:hypothetical protein